MVDKGETNIAPPPWLVPQLEKLKQKQLLASHGSSAANSPRRLAGSAGTKKDALPSPRTFVAKEPFTVGARHHDEMSKRQAFAKWMYEP